MKVPRLFPQEFLRSLQSRLVWLVMALTILAPAVGLFLYKPATASTMLNFISFFIMGKF